MYQISIHHPLHNCYTKQIFTSALPVLRMLSIQSAIQPTAHGTFLHGNLNWEILVRISANK
uniref:Uncharacterized protein n=1 Tax=Rhizophora mucronata TaxID=61149 RepID=A0A2P2IY40_RHIMU